MNRAYRVISSLLLFFVLIGCAFFSEYWEPSDVINAIDARKDNYPPIITIVSPTNGQTVSTNYTVSIRANDDLSNYSGLSNVYLSVDGEPFIEVTYNPAATFHQAVIIRTDPGCHTNVVYAIDNKGNVSTNHYSYPVCLSGVPAVEITTPDNLTLTNRNRIVFNGMATVGNVHSISSVEIKLNGGDYETESIFGTVFWAAQLDLEEGTNTIQVRANATSGQSAESLIWTIIVDTELPNIAISSITNMQLVGQSYTLSGTVSDSLTGVSNLTAWVDNEAPQNYSIINGSFSFDLSVTNFGIHTKTFAQGNISNLKLFRHKILKHDTQN